MAAKKKTAKQGELEGIEAPSHPELNPLMEEHAETAARMGTDRQRLGELNDELVEKAKKLKIVGTYKHPTAVPALTLTVKEGKTKAKVKRAKPAVEVDESEAGE